MTVRVTRARGASRSGAAGHHHRQRSLTQSGNSNTSSAPDAKPKVPKWTPAETQILLELRAAKPEVPYAKIAEKLGRTVLACRLHRFHTVAKQRRAALRLQEQQDSQQQQSPAQQVTQAPYQDRQLPALEGLSLHPPQYPAQYAWSQPEQAQVQHQAQQYQQYSAPQWPQAPPFRTLAPFYPPQPYPQYSAAPQQQVYQQPHPADHLSAYSTHAYVQPQYQAPEQHKHDHRQDSTVQPQHQAPEQHKYDHRQDSTVSPPHRPASMSVPNLLNPEK